MTQRNATLATLLLSLLLCAACGDEDAPTPDALADTDTLSLEIGPEGGALEGVSGTQMEGVRVEIPAGALSEVVTVEIYATSDDTPLPERAFAVGPHFGLSGGALALPVRVTIPYDPVAVYDYGEPPEAVKVWRRADAKWVLSEAIAHTGDTVTIELEDWTTVGAGVKIEE